MKSQNALITVNGVQFPDAVFRLEYYPTKRIFIIQPFPPQVSFSQVVDIENPQVVIAVEAIDRSSGRTLFRCKGPMSNFYVSFDSVGKDAGDKEFLEIAYTDFSQG